MGWFGDKAAGSQNKIIHQYSIKSTKISCGKIPKTAATIKPTKPDIHLKTGDQKRNSISEIIHNAIEVPNKSNPIPRSEPKNQLSPAKAIMTNVYVLKNRWLLQRPITLTLISQGNVMYTTILTLSIHWPQ